MRYPIIFLALWALPALATREIAFQCDERYCVLSRADWQWLMESTMKKDQLIQKCGWKDS